MTNNDPLAAAEEEMVAENDQHIFSVIGRTMPDVADILMILGEFMQELKNNPNVASAELLINEAVEMIGDSDNTAAVRMSKGAATVVYFNTRLLIIRALLLDLLVAGQWDKDTEFNAKVNLHGFMHKVGLASKEACENNLDYMNSYAARLGAENYSEYLFEQTIATVLGDVTLGRILTEASRRYKEIRGGNDGIA